MDDNKVPQQTGQEGSHLHQWGGHSSSNRAPRTFRHFHALWRSKWKDAEVEDFLEIAMVFQTFCGLILGSFVVPKLWDVWSSGCYIVLRCSHGCTRSWDVSWWWWHQTTGIRVIVFFELKTGRPYTPCTSIQLRLLEDIRFWEKPPLLLQDDPTMKHGQSSGKLLSRKPCASYDKPYAPKCMCLPRGMWPTSHGPWSLWYQRW